MKKLLALAVFGFVTTAFSQAVPAQAPSPRRTIYANGTESVALKNNYAVTLAASEKDKPSYPLSFVTATSRFQATTGDTFLTFSGEIIEREDGTLLVTYTLGINVPVPADTSVPPKSIEYRNSGLQSGAILTLDKPLKIFSAGSRDYTLTVAKAEKGK